MKKLFITIAFVAATMFASAQLYVGGSLGMGIQNGKDKIEGNGVSIEQDQPKAFTFVFAPEAGFMFADNMGVGLQLGFGFGKTTEKIYEDALGNPIDPAATQTIKTTTIGFAPYFRYVFAEVDNFKFYADARVSYLMSKPKVKYEQDGTTVTADGAKTTELGFGIVPGMAYQLTDNITMNCALNILELGFNSTKVKMEQDGVTATSKTNEIGFGINDPSPITIGFFYTF